MFILGWMGSSYKTSASQGAQLAWLLQTFKLPNRDSKETAPSWKLSSGLQEGWYRVSKDKLHWFLLTLPHLTLKQQIKDGIASSLIKEQQEEHKDKRKQLQYKSA